MKNILKLLIFLFSFELGAHAFTYYNNGYYPYNYSIRNNYNPYCNHCNHNYYRNNYFSPYYPYSNITTTRVQNVKKINGKLRRMRRMKELKKLENNISWFNDKNKNGSLTGYSVPISKNDIYTKLGIPPYNSNQRAHSINCNQDLFSSPSANEMYYDNGKFHKDIGGTTGKAGVTIIYD